MKRLSWSVIFLVPIVAVRAPPAARADILLVAASGSNQVEEFDAATGAPINLNFINTQTAAGGFGPSTLALDGNGHLFVTNDVQFVGNTVSEYDATTGKLISAAFIPATLTGLSGSSGSMAVGNGHLFIGAATTNVLGEYDAVTGKLIQNTNVGGEVYGMTVDSSGHLFVNVDTQGNHTIQEYNAVTGKLLNPNFTNAPAGSDPSLPDDPSLANITEMVVDSHGNLFVSAFTTLTTVREYSSTGAFIQTIGNVNPSGLVLNGSGGLLVSYNPSNTVAEYDASTGNVLKANFINPTGNGPDGMIFVPSSASVPEPGSFTLALFGALGTALGVWRNRRKNRPAGRAAECPFSPAQ